MEKLLLKILNLVNKDLLEKKWTLKIISLYSIDNWIKFDYSIETENDIFVRWNTFNLW